MLLKMMVRRSVRPTRKIPLQLILVVPFVVQTFAAVGLVGYFSFRNGQKAVGDLANQLISKASQQVDNHLDTYLALPQQLNRLNAGAIATDKLNLADPIDSEQHFWQQAQIFENISYIGYALPNGAQSGAGRWINGVDLLVYENLPGAEKTSDYVADSQGDRASLLQSYDYDPLTDGWYRRAVTAQEPTWSEIYAAQISNIAVTESDASASQNQSKANELNYYVAVSSVSPVYDQNNQLLAVLNVDLLLTNISSFLQGLKVSPDGQVFILERSGLLVGSSSSHSILYTTEEGTQRFSAFDSPDPLLRAIAEKLQAQFTNLRSIEGHQNLDLVFNGERQFVQITPWQDQYGLDWLVIVTVPESSFMAQINANTRITALFCLSALAATTALGVYTSRWISRPIARLTLASEAIAAGQLDQQIEATGIKEVDAVGLSFNRMGQQLNESFNELENRVEARTQELSQALTDLRQTQIQLVQTEKMSSLGQLVAGVAHEINNPVNFIHGNLVHTKEYTESLLNVIALYQETYPQPSARIQAELEEADLDFVKEDFPKILSSMQLGAERIREIIKSLRNFSRLDEAEFKAVDIHEGLDNTLMILHNRLKQLPNRPETRVIKNYAQLPLVECYPGQLNQVFMNLLSNAIDALDEYNKQRSPEEIVLEPSTITLTTELHASQWAVIRVADNGSGITEATLSKLFDPFFTTKSIGQGTGLGLSISYQIVTEKHKGKLYCHSVPGEGAEFVIEIPMKQS